MRPQIRALRERGSVVIADTCDLDARKRLAIERDLGDVPFTTRYEELTEDGHIDAVAVFTSMREHGEDLGRRARGGQARPGREADGVAIDLESTFPALRLNPEEIDLTPDPYRDEREGASTPLDSEVETAVGSI